MFYKLFTFLAVVAVAFANPNPKPDPQLVAYSAPGIAPLAYSAYSPVGYSAPYAAYPYAYSSGYYVR